MEKYFIKLLHPALGMLSHQHQQILRIIVYTNLMQNLVSLSLPYNFISVLENLENKSLNRRKEFFWNQFFQNIYMIDHIFKIVFQLSNKDWKCNHFTSCKWFDTMTQLHFLCKIVQKWEEICFIANRTLTLK